MKQEVLQQVVHYIQSKQKNCSDEDLVRIIFCADMSCLIEYGRTITGAVQFDITKPHQHTYKLSLTEVHAARFAEISNYNWLAVVDKDELDFAIDRAMDEDLDAIPLTFEITIV